MDFKDWRKLKIDKESMVTKKQYGKRLSNPVEAQIQEAQERGVFENLPGMGKPLRVEGNPYAGEKELGYSLLKSNGFVPDEIELAKVIRQEREQLERQRDLLIQRGRNLRQRRMQVFASEKRAYNNAVKQALASYETALRELNSKILTLNLTAPAPMHQPTLDVAQNVSQFREACPLFQ